MTKSSYRVDLKKNKRKKKKNSTHYRLNRRGRRVILVAAGVFFLFVFIFSAVKLVGMFFEYKQGRDLYEKIASAAIMTAEPEPESTEEPAINQEETIEPEETVISGALPWAGQEKISQETGVTVKWEKLQKQNKDTAAWLYLPDSDISYPVVQTDNNDYYLDHDYLHNQDESGTLFFDYRNFLEDTQENWIVYGHRRNDRSMFGNLSKYAKENYLREHPVMYLLFPDRAYRAEVFACRTVHAQSQFFQPFFYSSQEFQTYIDRAIEQSYWKPDFEVDVRYPVLTLATCSTYIGDNNPRLLVHARLIPIS